MKTRPITAVDRMLSWADQTTGDSPKARRRTHYRFGKLDLVVIERTDEPTVVYLTNDEGVIVEAEAWELLQAADALREMLANPLPVKRRPR
jgi:hypothetical protein